MGTSLGERRNDSHRLESRKGSTCLKKRRAVTLGVLQSWHSAAAGGGRWPRTAGSPSSTGRPTARSTSTAVPPALRGDQSKVIDGLDQVGEGEERHPDHRRRHGRLRDHRRPQLPGGCRRRLPRHRRPAADRSDTRTTASTRTPGSPTTSPTPRPPARPGRPAPRPTTTRSPSTARARRTRRCWSWPSRTGCATGNVTTSEIQDATPAVQVATSAARLLRPRGHHGDAARRHAKENGGHGSISEQLLDTRPDVTLGGGSATFAETATAGHVGGQDARGAGQGTRLQLLHRRRVTSPESASADQKRPLLGLFAPGNMPVRFAPLVATPGGATRRRRSSARRSPTFSQVPDAAVDDQQGDRPARPRTRAARRRASSSRSRVPRSTRRTTPPTRAARSVRPSRWTRRSEGAGLRPQGRQHAGHRHRRPRAHQPDRRRRTRPGLTTQAGHQRTART